MSVSSKESHSQEQAATGDASRRQRERWLYRGVLITGILLRVVTFLFLSPLNNDPQHYLNIKYIVQRHALPPTGVNPQSYHPPLYYLLAAPFEYLTGSPKGVQVFSLILSIATVLVLYQLICSKNLLGTGISRLYALLVVCFLPPFVIFGLYVSNDSLSFLLGGVIVWQASRHLEKPDLRRAIELALILAMGLLAKATFLVFIPVMALLVLLGCRTGPGSPRAAGMALALVVVALVFGSYKYVENAIYWKAPFISNQDFSYSWVVRQRQTYRGAASFADVNLGKLVASPTLTNATSGSYPLLLFGTFWYQHIPEGNFLASLHRRFDYIGSLTYVFALLPTAAFIAGCWVLLRHLKVRGVAGSLDRPEGRRVLLLYGCWCVFLANVFLLFAAVAKYHGWSIMQGRLLFPSIFGFLAAFTTGINALPQTRTVRVACASAMGILVALWGLYFVTEILYVWHD